MASDKHLAQNEYLDQFKDKEKAGKALARAWKNRDFEIELFWKRAIYFWGFIALAYAGYFKLDQYYRPFVALFGILLSEVWFLVHLGSKKWQQNWEKHIDMLEDEIEGPIYKTVLKPDSFSVSKLSQMVGVLNLLAWGILLIVFIVENYSKALEFSIQKKISISLLGAVFILVSWGIAKFTRTGEKKKISFKLREIEYDDEQFQKNMKPNHEPQNTYFKSVKSKINNKGYLIVFFALSLLCLGIPYLLPNDLPEWISPLIQGFGGNITAGIIQGLLFVFLALYLDAQTEEKICQIHAATTRSEEILKEREELLEKERTIDRFESFLREESCHNVTFPSLKTEANPLGLTYTIVPCRDQNGMPLQHVTEMVKLSVIKLRGPAHWNVLSDIEKQDYLSTPFKEGEYYFCRYFNSSWHMMCGTGMDKAYPFYLSSKLGQIEYGESANNFMRQFNSELENKDVIKTFYLLPSCKRYSPPAEESVCKHTIYKDRTSGKLFWQIDDSVLKSLNFSNDNVEIDNIKGYLTLEQLTELKIVLKEELASFLS